MLCLIFLNRAYTFIAYSCIFCYWLDKIIHAREDIMKAVTFTAYAQFTVLVIFLLGISTVAHAEYTVCRDHIDGKAFLECNWKGCPSGSSFVYSTPRNHPRCGSSSSACTSIKNLGWRSGHKTKFCIKRGYEGVISAAECKRGSSYSDGGWCFKKGAQQSCRTQLGCN